MPYEISKGQTRRECGQQLIFEIQEKKDLWLAIFEQKSGEEGLKIEKVRTFSNGGWCMWVLGVRFSGSGKGLLYLIKIKEKEKKWKN